MNRQYTALDLQCLNDRPGAVSFPCELSLRDCLAVMVFVGLVAGWGVDHWRSRRLHSANSSALAEIRIALENAQNEAQHVRQQLRNEQETLAAELIAEKETTGKLRVEIAALEAELRPARGPRYAAGRER